MERLDEREVLNSDDIEITIFPEFKHWGELTKEEVEMVQLVRNVIGGVFMEPSGVFWHMSYDIVFCPKCKILQGFYFHGHRVSKGTEHPDVMFHQDVFRFFCTNCRFQQKEIESMSFNHTEQRVRFMPHTQIPIYSGILVKNKSQE